MYTEDQFKLALKTCYNQYTKDLKPKWYKTGPEDKEIDRAWNLYAMSARTDLPMLLLGEIQIRSDDDLLTNVGTTAAKPMLNPSGDMANPIKVWDKILKTGDPEIGAHEITVGASNKTGSILNENRWWPLSNDAWMLGGVHSLTAFYLTMDAPPKDDVVWDGSERRPRVLGRELLGLKTFGYQRIKHDREKSLGFIFSPTDRAKAVGASFDDYLKAGKSFNGAAAIKEIFADNQAKAFNDYDKSKI